MTSLFDRLLRSMENPIQSRGRRPRLAFRARRRPALEALEDRLTPSGESFSAPIGSIPAGGIGVVRFDATIDEPLTKGIDRVYNQASISGTGLATFRSDDPSVSG